MKAHIASQGDRFRIGAARLFANHAASRPLDQVPDRPVDKAADMLSTKAAGRPVDKAAGKLLNKAADRPLEKGPSSSVEKGPSRPADKTAGRPSDKAAGRLFEKVADMLMEKVAGRPMEKAAGRPADKTASRLVEKVAGMLADKVAGRPVDKVAGRPVDKTGRLSSTSSGVERANEPSDISGPGRRIVLLQKYRSKQTATLKALSKPSDTVQGSIKSNPQAETPNNPTTKESSVPKRLLIPGSSNEGNKKKLSDQHSDSIIINMPNEGKKEEFLHENNLVQSTSKTSKQGSRRIVLLPSSSSKLKEKLNHIRQDSKKVNPPAETTDNFDTKRMVPVKVEVENDETLAGQQAFEAPRNPGQTEPVEQNESVGTRIRKLPYSFYKVGKTTTNHETALNEERVRTEDPGLTKPGKIYTICPRSSYPFYIVKLLYKNFLGHIVR